MPHAQHQHARATSKGDGSSGSLMPRDRRLLVSETELEAEPPEWWLDGDDNNDHNDANTAAKAAPNTHRPSSAVAKAH